MPTIAKSLDSVLYLFASSDEFRPALMQPNRIGPKTYISDARIMLVIPNEMLDKEYDCHAKAPDFEKVLAQAVAREPANFSLVDIRAALSKIKKVNDTSACECCERGKCPHCGHTCEQCDGSGETENLNLPKVYPRSEAGIKIADRILPPYYVDLIEKLMTSLRIDTLQLVGASTLMSVFHLGELIIAIMGTTTIEKNKVVKLNPMEA